MTDLHNAAQMALKILADLETTDEAVNASEIELRAALAAKPEPVYDTAVVKRIASQMGWTPPQPARKPMNGDKVLDGFVESPRRGLFKTFLEGVRFAEKYHGIGSKG